MTRLIKCSACGHDVATTAAACPNCGAPTPKQTKCPSCGKAIPINSRFCPHCSAVFSLELTPCQNCKTMLYPGVYKCPRCGAKIKAGKNNSLQTIIIVALCLATFLIWSLINSDSPDSSDASLSIDASSQTSSGADNNPVSDAAPTSDAIIDVDIESEAEIPVANVEELTLSQKNALMQAESYLRHSAFSYPELIDQLIYEGYPESDAIWAADNVEVDWYAEALEQAESYLSHFAFSKSGLADQLEYEGFTAEQIAFALEGVGY